jgi:antitoxin component of MazEF toxin-antitoxin module
MIYLRMSVFRQPMPIRTRRKLIKVGSSESVTLPKNWIEGTGLSHGDTIELYGDGILLVIPSNVKVNHTRALGLLNQLTQLGASHA